MRKKLRNVVPFSYVLLFCIHLLEFVSIKLQAVVSRYSLAMHSLRYGSYKRLMSLLLHGCCSRVFLLVAETKDRFNYSVPEPDVHIEVVYFVDTRARLEILVQLSDNSRGWI